MMRSIGMVAKSAIEWFFSCCSARVAVLLALFITLGVDHPALAAIAYVQGNSGAEDMVTSVQVNYGNVQVAGSLNVVVVSWHDGVSSGIASVSDTSGNSYALAIGPTTSAGNAKIYIYYAKNIVAAAQAANTVTVAFTNSTHYADIRIAEYSGIDTVNPLDGASGASGSGTSLNSGAITTTNANDLLIGANFLETETASLGSGYTQRLYTGWSHVLEDRIVTSTGSYDASVTQTAAGWWVMQVVAFKAAASGGDTQAPTTPTNLSAAPVSNSQINLSWTASTDNVGVTEYRVESCMGASCTNFAQIATPTTTGYNNAGLVASTTYRYRVRASDAAGNLSAYSSIVDATTSAADTQAPTIPTGLVATVVSSAQINLSWAASTDNVAVTGYRIERCTGASCTNFAQIAAPTAISYSNTGLTAATTYRYRIRASDAVPNLSNYSSIVTATTSAGVVDCD